MISSPIEAVVGASSVDASAVFLELFGFERRGSGSLPERAVERLYGLSGPAEECVLEVPGAERGLVRLVSTPVPPRQFAPFDPRPFAIDLFTVDVDRSVAMATEKGWHASPITEHRMGPVVIREVEIIGPDGLVVTLLQPSVGRRSCVLDLDPERLHSEVHAFVWSASELDELLPFWLECGLQKPTDVVLDTPGLGALVGVPEEDVSMRLVVLSDAEDRPIRVELVDFLGREGAGQPTLPLAAGLHAPAFVVPSLEDARAAMPSATFGEAVEIDTSLHPSQRAATVVSPGGQRFELWEQRA